MGEENQTKEKAPRLVALRCVKTTQWGGRIYKMNVEYPVGKLGGLDSRKMAVWVKAHFEPVYEVEEAEAPADGVDEQTVLILQSSDEEEATEEE